MAEQMDPSRVNSAMGVDPRSNSENKYPRLHAMEFLRTVQWTTFMPLLANQSETSLSYVLMFLISLGVDIFTMPIWVIGGTLLYFNQRIRKEGFDIEMMVTRHGE